MMKTLAAVAVAAGQPLEVMDVNLEGPKRGEVLIEIKATGLCHTDEFTRSGDDPEGIFPAILGHEGAGVVLEVGEGVTTLEVGDHVIPLYTPECRECEYCLSGKTNLCQAIRVTQGQGLLPDGLRVADVAEDNVWKWPFFSALDCFDVILRIEHQLAAHCVLHLRDLRVDLLRREGGEW